MKLPSKVNVGPVEYKVIFPYEFKECNDRVAQHSYTEAKIWISDKYDGRLRQDYTIKNSLLHELLHAIDVIFIEGDLEEGQIVTLGNILCGVFKKTSFKNIPEIVEIGGLEYSILYPYHFSETKEFFSYSDHSSCTIFVNEDVNKYAARLSSFFQILSIINLRFSIRMSEADIMPMGTGILDTLDRNNLWKFFSK